MTKSIGSQNNYLEQVAVNMNIIKTGWDKRNSVKFCSPFLLPKPDLSMVAVLSLFKGKEFKVGLILKV